MSEEEIKVKKSSNLEAKRVMSEMMELIDQVEAGTNRYLIAKMIDLFIELPSNYQKAFMDYFCEALPNERWTSAQNDDTLYIGALRAITLHFTGLEKAGQPHLKDLKVHLVEFQKSDHYKKAAVVIRPKKAFTESLKEI